MGRIITVGGEGERERGREREREEEKKGGWEELTKEDFLEGKNSFTFQSISRIISSYLSLSLHFLTHIRKDIQERREGKEGEGGAYEEMWEVVEQHIFLLLPLKIREVVVLAGRRGVEGIKERRERMRGVMGVLEQILDSVRDIDEENELYCVEGFFNFFFFFLLTVLLLLFIIITSFLFHLSPPSQFPSRKTPQQTNNYLIYSQK